jgi:hypothetical protein
MGGAEGMAISKYSMICGVKVYILAYKSGELLSLQID